MEGNPLVSVIITTCNGDYKLVRAVDSVLMQTYNNIEIIVVDDNGNGTASRIETEKMMEKFSNTERVIYLKHEQNKNGSAARNTGIRTAKGKYVAFLDDDDVFEKTRIKKCVKTAEQNKGEYNAVYTGVLTVANGLCLKKFTPSAKSDFSVEILKSHSALGSGSNIFVPMEAVRKIQGFDEKFVRFQDIEFMIRISKIVRMYPVEEALIIKDNSNTRFMPNFKRFLQAVNLFFETFHDEINQSVYKKEIYNNKYNALLLYAYECADKNNIRSAWDTVNRMDCMGTSSKIKIMLKGQVLKHSNSKLYRLRKILSMKKQDKKIRKSLTENEKLFLDSLAFEEERNT